MGEEGRNPASPPKVGLMEGLGTNLVEERRQANWASRMGLNAATALPRLCKDSGGPIDNLIRGLDIDAVASVTAEAGPLPSAGP
jgi:hypothetical protein